jgi:hypothetical protein
MAYGRVKKKMKIKNIQVHPFKLEGVAPFVRRGHEQRKNIYTDVDFKEFMDLLPGENFDDEPWNLPTVEEQANYWNEYLSQILPTLTERQITQYLLLNERVVFDEGRKLITLYDLQPGTVEYVKRWHDCIDALFCFHKAFCMFVAKGVVTLTEFKGTVITGQGYGVNNEEVGNNINPPYNNPNDSTFFA